MLRTKLNHLTVPLLLLFGISAANSQTPGAIGGNETGTLEKMMVAKGDVTMNLDLNRLNGTATRESKLETLRFEAGPNSFFTILVFNNVLRGPELGSMGLIRQNSAILPDALNTSSNQLIIEKIDSSEPFDLVVRDGKTGFVFFNIEGHQYNYDAATHLLGINDGRLLISDEFARKLGRPGEAGSTIGKISTTTLMRPIEITTVANGTIKSVVMPAAGGATQRSERDPGTRCHRWGSPSLIATYWGKQRNPGRSGRRNDLLQHREHAS